MTSSTPPTTLLAYGVAFRSAFPFRFHLATTSAPVQLTFELVATAPLAAGWDDEAASFEARDATTGVATAEVREIAGWHVLRFLAAADFFVRDERILCVLRDPRYRFAIDVWFLGTVLTYWLELHGIPVLHAASVEVPGGCVAFLANHGAGKSTLAASFVAEGHRLLGDDVLPLEWRTGRAWGRPGYPQMRLWPDQARRLLGSDAGLPRVQPAVPKLYTRVGAGGFGSFCPEPRPLLTLYLPQRVEGGDVTIGPLGLGEAILALVRHSFLSGLVEASGLTSTRFGRFAEIVRNVPVRRLRYPTGHAHLPSVRDAVLTDIGGS